MTPIVLRESWRRSVKDVMEALNLSYEDMAEFINVDAEDLHNWLNTPEEDVLRCPNCGCTVESSEPNAVQGQGIVHLMGILSQLYPQKIAEKVFNYFGIAMVQPQAVMQGQNQAIPLKQPPSQGQNQEAPQMMPIWKEVGGGQYL